MCTVYKVVVRKSVGKAIKKMPKKQVAYLYNLIDDLEKKGPVRVEWPNYSVLKGTNTHHCHLSRKWVACWVETKQGIQIEVTYAGSRENSPYA
jgi:hypothetical protein